MFAEEKYCVVLKNQAVDSKSFAFSPTSFVLSDEKITFDNTNGSSIVTEPVLVHTQKVKIINSTRKFTVALYELRNVNEEENKDGRHFYRMLIPGANDFKIKSFLMNYGTGFDAVDCVNYFRNEPGDWIW